MGMLDKGKWCSTAADCTNSYVQYDVAGYGTGYYECVSNGKTCGPEKTEEGMTVWKFCSDVCLATSGTSKLPMGGCDAGPLTEPRYTSKTACESYSEDVTVAGGPTTFYPCTWQGPTDTGYNAKCRPDFFPQPAACNCVKVDAAGCTDVDSVLL